jgi:hypothetical protein
MRAFARLLIFALSVSVVSCGGGGTLPVVHDYTNAGPQVNPKPQSVIPPCQHQPGPGGGCGGPGCEATVSDNASQGVSAESGVQVRKISTWVRATPECVGSGGGYNTSGEEQCNADGGDYLSLQDGSIQCAINGNSVSVNNPFSCPFTIVLNAPNSIELATYSIISPGPPVTVNKGSILGFGGIRVGYDCQIEVDS